MGSSFRLATNTYSTTTQGIGYRVDSMRRLLFIVLTVLLAFAAVNGLLMANIRGTNAAPGQAAAQTSGPGFGLQTANQPKLQTAVIDTGDLKLTVSATGHLAAKVQSNLGFDQPGQVSEILVEEG